MADDAAAAEERRRKAQARKDKIAGRGADRLARITGAAKGDGAGERFGTGGSAPVRPTSSSSSSTFEQTSPRQTLPALAAPAFNPLDDPPDIDISSTSARQGFQGIPDFSAGGVSSDGTPDILSALLSGQGGLGGGDGFPQQFAQMFGGQPGATPIQIQAPRQKTWADRLLPLIHLISMVGLAFYAIFVIEPRIREGYDSVYSTFSDRSTWTSIGNVDWNGWAALARGKQGDASTSNLAQGVEDAWLGLGRGVGTVQIMYIFLTLELILQSSAIFIFKTRPPMPSLLNSIMPYLPPNLAAYAHTGMRYWSLLGQLLDDLAVLVLSVVGFILYAEYSQLGHDGKIKIE